MFEINGIEQKKIVVLLSAWKSQFGNLSCRLAMYRRCYATHRKEIVSLKKIIKHLRQKIQNLERIIEDHEDFMFGPLLSSVL